MYETAIYIGEVETQISFAERAFKEFKTSVEANEIESIFYHSHHFLIHATNVDKLINSKKATSRNRLLEKFSLGKDVDLKKFRELRNHLEHYEERLDSWIERYSGSTFFDRSVVTGAVGFPFEIALRTLDNGVFVFLGERYDLEKLYQDILKIKDRLPPLTER